MAYGYGYNYGCGYGYGYGYQPLLVSSYINPSLGPVEDGKQVVGVYDRKLGNRRELKVSPETADAFVTERYERTKAAYKKGLKITAGITTIGAAIGAGVKALATHKAGADISKMLKPIGKNALFGGAIALSFGILAPLITADRADRKITNKFIAENK